MFYKPKYCCNCGEKVERADWNALTSRRFCVPCADENRRHDYVPRLLIAAGALGMMFGFGSLFGGSGGETESMRSGVSSPTAFRQQEPEKVTDQKSLSSEQSSSPVSRTTGAETVVPPTGPLKQQNGTQYFCGALTKKGTPCSRKVKADGTRCFQHEGKAAAPPQNQ